MSGIPTFETTVDHTAIAPARATGGLHGPSRSPTIRMQPSAPRIDPADASAEMLLRPGPGIGAGTIHDPATLSSRGASAAPLVECLQDRLARIGLGRLDAEAAGRTAEALDALIDERTRTSGREVRMTRQHVLMAKGLFEQLPDRLLLESDSLLREMDEVLARADEEHGGRAALRDKVGFALAQAQAHREGKLAASEIDMACVRRYKSIDTFLALDALDREHVKLHPGHMMAACLTLARKYAGRSDISDIGRLNLAGALGDLTLAKVIHAEVLILEESMCEGSPVGLASSHVGVARQPPGAPPCCQEPPRERPLQQAAASPKAAFSAKRLADLLGRLRGPRRTASESLPRGML